MNKPVPSTHITGAAIIVAYGQLESSAYYQCNYAGQLKWSTVRGNNLAWAQTVAGEAIWTVSEIPPYEL